MSVTKTTNKSICIIAKLQIQTKKSTNALLISNICNFNSNTSPLLHPETKNDRNFFIIIVLKKTKKNSKIVNLKKKLT